MPEKPVVRSFVRSYFHYQVGPISMWLVIIVSCADFSGYHNYLEDPPWLGPTRKILKKLRFQDRLKTIKFKAFWKKFPDFSRFSQTFSKNSPFSRFSRFSLTAGNPVFMDGILNSIVYSLKIQWEFPKF